MTSHKSHFRHTFKNHQQTDENHHVFVSYQVCMLKRKTTSTKRTKCHKPQTNKCNRPKVKSLLTFLPFVYPLVETLISRRKPGLSIQLHWLHHELKTSMVLGSLGVAEIIFLCLRNKTCFGFSLCSHEFICLHQK